MLKFRLDKSSKHLNLVSVMNLLTSVEYLKATIYLPYHIT